MNSQKILLITGQQSEFSYYRHYNNFFNRKKDFMCYKFNSECNPKQFCEQNDFSPDVILFDYCFTNFVILGPSFSEIKSDYLAGFDDCIKILHSHKDMHPETLERVKRFCDILDIENLFHINCIFF